MLFGRKKWISKERYSIKRSRSEMQSVIIHKHKSKKFLSLFILTMYFYSLSQNCIHSTFHSNFNRFANRFALNENADNFFLLQEGVHQNYHIWPQKQKKLRSYDFLLSHLHLHSIFWKWNIHTCKKYLCLFQ